MSDGLRQVRGWLTAGLLGGLAFGAMALFSVPGLDPSLWEDTAAVAGLRPPQTVFSGCWRAVVWAMVRGFGLEAALRILPALGWATAALSVVFFYQVVRQLMAQLARMSRKHAVWDLRIAPFFAVASTLLFAAGDPLWRVSQTLSPAGLQVLLFLAVVYLSLLWYGRCGRWCAYAAFVLMGLLAAETPFAFALPFAFVALHAAVWNRTEEAEVGTPDDFAFSRLPKWRLLFLFFAGLAAGAALNMHVFRSLGGAVAHRWAYGTAWFWYATSQWHCLADAATLFGWLLGLCFGLLPFVLALRLAPRALRDDRRMPFGIGVLLLFVAVVALMQTGAYPPARFWTFDLETDAELVSDGFLLAFFTAGATAALGLIGAAFAFECQRKYLSEVRERILDDVEPDETSRRELVREIGEQEEMRPANKALKWMVPVLFALLVACALVQLPRPVETAMQRVVQEAVSEIVKEAGDAAWLFSDGRLDPAIELEAFRRGRTLRALDMMAGGDPWSVTVRLRGLDVASADGQAAATGVPVLFRTWAGERQNGLDESAMLLGFEFWKRAKKPLPTLSGFVGRTAGLSKEAAEAGIARSRKLSDCILALSSRLASAEPTLALQRAYTAVTWRLSRLADLRNERELADGLVESSSLMKRLFGAIEEERQRILMLMTPREGLQLALERTNFAEARRYATVILGYDEENLQANFAMGMSAIAANRMQEAELYLTKCHRFHPREVAVVNNLSIVCRKLGKYDEAIKYAKLAVELLPDSQEAKQTLEDAEKRRP